MPIVFNYAAVADVNEKVGSCHKLLTESLENLRSRLQQLDWEGEDRTAYNEHQRQWDNAVTRLIDLLPQIQTEVANASTGFADNELRGARRFSG